MKKSKVFIRLIAVILLIAALAVVFTACSDIKSMFTVNATNLADYANFTYKNGDSKISFSLKGSDENWVTVSWDTPVTFNSVMLYESGDNITGFEIYVNDELVYAQDSVGKMREIYLGTTTASNLTVKVTSCSGSYKLTDIGVYNLARNRSFRSTAFIRLGEGEDPLADVNLSNLRYYTDVILYSPSYTFNGDGSINIDESKLKSIRTRLKSVNLAIKTHVIIIPASEDEKQSVSVRDEAFTDNGQAFSDNIKSLMKNSALDGIVFDLHNDTNVFDFAAYNTFIEELRGKIISPYEIGVVTKPNNIMFGKKAKSYIDNFYILTPDIFASDRYPSFEQSVCETLEKLKDSDLPLMKSQLTIPFYGYAPSQNEEERVIYDYADYASELGKFSNSVAATDTLPEIFFNGYTAVKDKTALCYDFGAAGVVAVCADADLPVNNNLSLTLAITNACK